MVHHTACSALALRKAAAAAVSWVDERNRFGGLVEFFSQRYDANFSVQ
eukprot:COSAG02_NODE_6197_length_3735_cov_148.018427_3_plen_48_part_00